MPVLPVLIWELKSFIRSVGNEILLESTILICEMIGEHSSKQEERWFLDTKKSPLHLNKKFCNHRLMRSSSYILHPAMKPPPTLTFQVASELQDLILAPQKLKDAIWAKWESVTISLFSHQSESHERVLSGVSAHGTAMAWGMAVDSIFNGFWWPFAGHYSKKGAKYLSGLGRCLL